MAFPGVLQPNQSERAGQLISKGFPQTPIKPPEMSLASKMVPVVGEHRQFKRRLGQGRRESVLAEGYKIGWMEEASQFSLDNGGAQSTPPIGGHEKAG